eukprot:TRINITY_DN1515_c0_g1_i2.p1 TRINITY_DN1515_c0_g1~~TRINITY_DN1515_c0_g1_i2.p1  ORF type:complete len:636 (+),score=184.40 TRINITY_DN1515_c0_g1_i2:1123-3030(+)
MTSRGSALWDDKAMSELEAEVNQILNPRKENEESGSFSKPSSNILSEPKPTGTILMRSQSLDTRREDNEPLQKALQQSALLDEKKEVPMERERTMSVPSDRPRATTNKTLFKVHLFEGGFVTIELVPTMTLQQLLTYVARKRRYTVDNSLSFTSMEGNPLELTTTLGEIPQKTVKLVNSNITSTLTQSTPHASVSPDMTKGNFQGKGWLTKEGGTFKTWRRRWMVLKDRTIIYAKHESTGQLGEINLKGLNPSHVTKSNYKGRKNLLAITTPTRTFYLQGDSTAEIDQWFNAIKGVLSAPSNHKVGYTDFEILKLVGKGNFGKVLQVRKKDTGVIYAMKVLDKKSILENDEFEHTLTERNILATLVHPFLIGLHFSFQTQDKLFFVMDFINGGDIFFHLQNDHNFPADRARFYAAQIICGMQYLHQQGVIYRDLKAENLILNDDGYVLMTDFGISKTGLNTDTSKATTFCGTPEYLAPEILDGNGYTKAVDWWAVGILLFEMLSGNPPFYSQNIQTMYSKISAAQLNFPDRPSFDEATKDIISQLLEKDPEKRLQYALNIRSHRYFKTIDWELLLQKRLTPPYMPNVKDKSDTSMVDPMFTKESGRLTMNQNAISPDAQRKFENFTFVTDHAKNL